MPSTTCNPTNTAFRVLALGGLMVGAAIYVSSPAHAIDCDGNYQIVQGRPIATPYCQDNNLARVARQYGMRVSNTQIRHSESAKAQACRLVGHDNRVSEACAAYRYDPGYNRRF